MSSFVEKTFEPIRSMNRLRDGMIAPNGDLHLFTRNSDRHIDIARQITSIHNLHVINDNHVNAVIRHGGARVYSGRNETGITTSRYRRVNTKVHDTIHAYLTKQIEDNPELERVFLDFLTFPIHDKNRLFRHLNSMRLDF